MKQGIKQEKFEGEIVKTERFWVDEHTTTIHGIITLTENKNVEHM